MSLYVLLAVGGILAANADTVYDIWAGHDADHIVLAGQTVRSRLECALRCDKMAACTLASFNSEDRYCKLLSRGSPLDTLIQTIPVANTNLLVQDSASVDWRMVFRFTAGSGENMKDHWLSAAGINAHSSSLMSTEMEPPGIYKEDDLDINWEFVDRVKISVYKSGAEVGAFLFDASGTDRQGWFYNPLDSTYSDFFDYESSSRRVHQFYQYFGSGRWFVTGMYFNCNRDSFWLLVTDRGQDCAGWEQPTEYPVIHYSKTDSYARALDPAEIGHADVLAIYCHFTE